MLLPERAVAGPEGAADRKIRGLDESEILIANNMARYWRYCQLSPGLALVLGGPGLVLSLAFVEQSQIFWPLGSGLRRTKQALVRIGWCYRRLFCPFCACYFLMVVKVDIGHHPVWPLHHGPVPGAGGGERGAQAAGAGALVAVAQITFLVRTEAHELFV